MARQTDAPAIPPSPENEASKRWRTTPPTQPPLPPVRLSSRSRRGATPRGAILLLYHPLDSQTRRRGANVAELGWGGRAQRALVGPVEPSRPCRTWLVTPGWKARARRSGPAPCSHRHRRGGGLAQSSSAQLEPANAALVLFPPLAPIRAWIVGERRSWWRRGRDSRSGRRAGVLRRPGLRNGCPGPAAAPVPVSSAVGPGRTCGRPADAVARLNACPWLLPPHRP